ncbi:MAG: adenylate/guanylate cyclase domain-containing protein, partial [Anaerolineales bacterium]|nr:adenylate/guanylate cyclase domain-containing protein [Anaerolineales bacterium]
MADPQQTEIEKLLKSIAGLEAQGEVLGDEVVDPALESLREKLADLETQLAQESSPTPTEERRLITILFSDVVGSTALAEKLDPEEWRGIISRLHASCGEIIQEHTGQVAQYLGDGLLAFFG